LKSLDIKEVVKTNVFLVKFIDQTFYVEEHVRLTPAWKFIDDALGEAFRPVKNHWSSLGNLNINVEAIVRSSNLLLKKDFSRFYHSETGHVYFTYKFKLYSLESGW